MLFATLATTLALVTPVQGRSVPLTASDAKPLTVGAKVPDGKVRSMEGKEVRLSQVLAKKPTVMVFYRGGWCPFCNAHLAELGRIEKDVRAKGYQMVAISPDTPEELNKTREKNSLTYRLFSDSSGDLLRKFGVAFRVDDETFTTYRDKYHIDLERASGSTQHLLPVPSVFVIGKDSKVVFVHSNPDYRVRLSGGDLLKALDDYAKSSTR